MVFRKQNLMVVMLLLAISSPGWAAVETQFIAPEKYKDAVPSGRGSAVAKDSTLVAIKAQLDRLGKRYLAPDETLRIKVLDVDLAGEMKPVGSHLEQIRVMKSITWPSMRLHYELVKNGKTQSNGEDDVSDMSYLEHANRYANGDPLRYEKVMLEDWFAKKWGQR